MCTPANTPATPPNFPETLLAFSKMSTGSGPGPAGQTGAAGQTAGNLETKSPNPISPLVTHHHLPHYHQFSAPSNLVMRSKRETR